MSIFEYKFNSATNINGLEQAIAANYQLENFSKNSA